MAPAPWQLPSAVAEPSARGEFRLAQSGAQLGATTRARSVTALKTRSGQLAFRIRLALGILLLRYAHIITASTAPLRRVPQSQRFNLRSRANPCRPQPCPQRSDTRKWNIPLPE